MSIIYLILIILIVIAIVLYNNNNKSKKKNVNINDIEIIERPETYQKYISSLNKNNVNKNKFQFYDKKTNITDDVLNNNIKPILTKSVNTNPSNNVIDNVLKPTEFTKDDVVVLKNKGYLNNFYYDMYGNRINASLKDYFVNYATTIDNDDETDCVKVNIIKKKGDFIIPNQYPTLKYKTNAYNIDWSRIIHPLTYY
jgi:hypothetical protein